MHSSVGVFQGRVSNQIAEWRMGYLRQTAAQAGGGGGGVLKEFLGGDLPLGPGNP